MLLKVCKKCGKQVSTPGRFCPHCGENGFPNKGMNGCLALLLVFIGLGVFVNLIDPFRHRDTESNKPKMSEEEKRRKTREALDPPTSAPLTARQHLEAAKRLLAKLDVAEYGDTFVIIQLISEHGAEARKDPHTKAQADALMKRMANKALDVEKMKAWNEPMAEITAEVDCKLFIKSNLKAPSTADWLSPSTGRWSGHPGYFLVTQTVDAQNSFGAKIRSSYQCRVVCLSGDLCEVEKMYEVAK
jgi:hypothetical protein